MDAHCDTMSVACPRICLCVFCGLPAAGKSTLAQVVPSHITLLKQGWRTFVISYDELIPDDAFDFQTTESDDKILQTQTKWKLHRQAVLSCMEQFLESPHAPNTIENEGNAWHRFSQTMQEQQVLNALGNSSHPPPPLIVLLDDNFYYQSMRYEVYQLARKYSLGFCQVYLQCPVELCLSRNQLRPQPLPDEVLVEMAKRIEPPNPHKNPWEHSSVTLNSSDNVTEEDIQKLIQLISSALDNPLSPIQDDTKQKEADRQSCASSVVHQADQACRRLVSQAMHTARENKVSSESMRSLAKELNESKTRFLQDLRKHVLQGYPVSPGEPIDMDRVVRQAVSVFDQEKEETMRRHCINLETTLP